MEKKRYDAVVIGAGVTGSAIARELSRYQAEICVLEKGEDVCTGTSKANSAIVHGGFDAKTGSLKAKMNVLGNRMMTQVAEELDVPFRRNGAFVLCFDENDMPALKELYERGVTNGVENLKILTGDEAREMEPALSDTVVAALFCPSSGIVCPFELTLGFAENAEKNGVEFKFECGVQNIRRENDLYILETEQGEIETRAVINAAGVHADEIHDMLLPHAFTITPRRGEYCLSKAGVAMATKLYAVKMAEFGVPVYEIRPGVISSDMTSVVKEKYDKLIAEGLTLQPRWGEPADIGKAVAMLLRGDLAYSTGQVIKVDGGMEIGRL